MDLGIFEERIHNARLNIYQPDGQVLRLGHTGPVIDWHIHTPNTLTHIIKHPELKLGASYVNGEWDVNGQELAALIGALVPHTTQRHFLHNQPCLRRLRARLPHPRQSAPQPQWSDDNLWLSRLCLGNELLQTCGYYIEPGVTTEQAQRTTVHRLKSRLGLCADQHILDLNAGWGMLAILLAEQTGVRVTAVVTTREQLQFAHSEVRRRGLDGQVHVRMGCFYQCRGRFDRILADGFLEHYAEPSYPALLEHLETLLHDEGLAWLQVSGRSSPPGLSHRWHQQQLPARHSLPLMSELIDGLETTRLRSFALEDHSAHQLRDLNTRARRFQRERTTISQRFGENQTRHWEFLLASQVAAFKCGQLRQYEMVLGNIHTQWPLHTISHDQDEACLPVEVANSIPGLARDI